MSELKFDPSVGVILPTAQEIRDDLAAQYVSAFKVKDGDPELNTDSSSPMGQIIDMHVAEIEEKNSQIAYLLGMLNPKTAKGVFLDNLAGLYFLERKIAEPTIVKCLCRGIKGTQIPIFSVVKDNDGNYFRSSKSFTIGDDGTVEIDFTAVNGGAIEVAKGTVTEIVTVVSGWDSVINNVPGATGNVEETDTELRYRMKQSVSVNATSEASSIEANIANISGVLDCVVLENYTNAAQTIYGQSVDGHSIAVCAYGGSDAAIASAIWSRKAAGCGTSGNTLITYEDKVYTGLTYKYYIVRPSVAQFKVKVTLWNKSISDNTKAAIIEKIKLDFLGNGDNQRVGMAETVYAARWLSVINSVSNEILVRSITVALGSGSFSEYIDIPANKFPTISDSDISIVFS